MIGYVRMISTKTIMLLIIVSMVVFIIPDSFAQTALPDCTDNDIQTSDSYMTLTSTTNSITVNFSPDDIGCEPPGDDPFFNFLTLLDSAQYFYGAVNGDTFEGLEPNTAYTVDVNIYYGNYSGEPLGGVIQTIRTLSENPTQPPIEPEPTPEPCVNIDDSYMILTPTHNSITINFSADGLGCELDDIDLLHNFVAIQATVQFILGAVNGDSIQGLEPDTEYTVGLDVRYIDQGGDLLGQLNKIIRTLPEPEPEPELEPEPCTNLDDSYLTLSSTTDSIAIYWSVDLLDCYIPIDNFTIFNILTLESENDTFEVHDAVNSHTFTNLQSNTAYTLTNIILYVEDNENELVLIDTITKIIYTQEEDAQFEPEPCGNLDNSFLTLSSTTDSITANWLELACDIPSDISIVYVVRLVDDNISSVYDTIVEYTFTNLDSNTEYTVELYISYLEAGGTETDLVLLDIITETIFTKEKSIVIEPMEEPEPPIEPIPPIEPEPPIEPIPLPEPTPLPEPEEEFEEKSNGGCIGDCIAPTIGLGENTKRLVENGFSYNNNPVDVIKWHTPYPLITAIVGETNTVEIIAYDNIGITNLDRVQFGLGVEHIGQPLDRVEVLIEVYLETVYGDDIVRVEKVVIHDRDNLIDTYGVFATTDVVQCMDDADDSQCLKVTLDYSYREAPFNNIMLVNVIDNYRNAQSFYLNEGVEVIGESMNPIPYVILNNKHTSQQTEDLTKVLYRMDKITNIWKESNGVEYLKINDNRFERITPLDPYVCNDPLLSEINVPTRTNCHFRALTPLWHD